MKKDQPKYFQHLEDLKPRFQKIILIFFVATMLLQSCKKEFKDDTIRLSEGTPQITNGPIPPYIFDWETTTYMPSLPNANPVPMPWNSGTTAIDPNLVSDFKKSEGWEMVWNTFGPTIQLKRSWIFLLFCFI